MIRIIIISVSLLSLVSCQTFKQWEKKGHDKGWLTTASISIDTVKVLHKDTTRLNGLVDSTNRELLAIVDTVFNFSPKETIKDTLIVRITKYMKGKFKDRIVKLPVYVDDSLQVKNAYIDLVTYYKNGELSVKVNYIETTVISPLLWYERYWWVWLIIGTLFGCGVFYFANMKVK